MNQAPFQDERAKYYRELINSANNLISKHERQIINSSEPAEKARLQNAIKHIEEDIALLTTNSTNPNDFTPLLRFYPPPSNLSYKQWLAEQALRPQDPYDVSNLPSPYPGLRSFSYDDRAIYTGRQTEINFAVQKLTNRNAALALLFVTGASGSGKSSFAQAGLLPALEAYYYQHNQRIRHAIVRPGSKPLLALENALKQFGIPFPGELTRPLQFSQHLAQNTSPGQINLLIIDQFEEIFAQTDLQARGGVLGLLAEPHNFNPSNTHIIATLRSDYLPDLFKYEKLYTLAKDGVELRAIQPAQLAESILRPLQVRYPNGEKQFEPALLNKLASEAAQEAAYLPLLQVTLEDLWRKGFLRLSAYTNLTDAIRQRAETVYQYRDYNDLQRQERSSDEQAEIMRLLLALVTVSLAAEVRHDVRRPRQRADLEKNSPLRAQLINDLTAARLLSVGVVEEAGVKLETVDIIHESLITNWTRLHDEIDKQRQLLQRRTRFEQALNEWRTHQNNKDYDDYLLNGVYLAEARELQAANNIALNNAEAQDFLNKSLALQQKRTRQRWQIAIGVIAGLSVFLVAAIIASIFAVGNANEANNQKVVAQKNADEANIQRAAVERQSRATKAQALAAAALDQFNVDQERSILLASEAINTTRKFNEAVPAEATDAMRSILSRSRLAAVLSGHTRGVTSASFSPDGRTFATSSEDGTVKIWDTNSGKEISTLEIDKVGISKVSFSPDGQKVVVASTDSTASIWQVQTKKLLISLKGHKNFLYSAAFSYDGTKVVTAGNDRTTRIWDATTGQQLVLLEDFSGSVVDAQFNRSGDKIVTASNDNTARIWNISSRKELLKVQSQVGNMTSASFSPDDTKILTSSTTDAGVRLWDAVSGKELANFKGHNNTVSSAVFSSDGKKILTASWDLSVRVWDVQTTQQLFVLRGHSDLVFRAAFSPDANYIVSVGRDRTARLWTSQPRGQIQANLKDYSGEVVSVAYNPDSKTFMTSGPAITAIAGRIYPTTTVWDSASAKEVFSLKNQYGAVYSPDGRYVASAGQDAAIKIWEVATGKELTTLKGHTEFVLGLVYSPDGRYLATSSWDETIKIWEAATGKELATLKSRGHTDLVFILSFSPQGQYLVTVSNNDGTAKIWETATGKELATLTGHSRIISSAFFSPKDNRLVTGSYDKTAKIWDVPSGKEIATLRGHNSEISGVGYSLDGRFVITTGQDGEIRVWDASTTKLQTTLLGHTSAITGASFSRSINGGKSYLAAISEAGAVRTWELETGRAYVTVNSLDNKLLGSGLSPDGRYLVTARGDGLLEIQVLDADELLKLAQSRVTRQLTENERVQFNL